MIKWKRPWINSPAIDESYICVFNEGGDSDDYLKTGIAAWNDKEKIHYIEPYWLPIDAYMRYWCEIPDPPEDFFLTDNEKSIIAVVEV